ncbi:MAG: TIGR00282 family metallophosphoesterase [Alphaproteobacteria bacterium]|nr:TIGR00282 family metallophosphoesterase [Alphaproteobacteria bacterium]MCZ6494918.1 TIGR00282 family metallophosphoesterase [Alphaproteobacteria bacterium]MCZ6609675.1 TIGR00282 family metallophosphoesterase [Alphaproteobacteria bacterium]MCZ6741678.1 TIGR00282 family metallophosphoesterase [Alphaproteobacteria bacterium]MCZ6849419.1 TIGR00282 family metallophosphoesterase [Alphaproteobacteria bacterium]
MNLLFCGDIVGRSGRQAIEAYLPGLRDSLALDFVVANGENAAAGFGITAKICGQLHDFGVDVITTGNHVFDQREIIPHLDNDTRILRPANYPPGTPGKGATVVRTAQGKEVLVIQVMLRLFMEALDDPFRGVEEAIAEHRLGESVDAIIVDVHGEATSEKSAMGHVLDGRVSLVVGSHSHIPTADGRILENGTAYQTDAGMCGDYDSVIGMEKEEAIARFVTRMRKERLAPAMGEGTLSAVFVETDDATGLARLVAPVRVGGVLEETHQGAK